MLPDVSPGSVDRPDADDAGRKFSAITCMLAKTMDDVFTPEQRNGMDLYTALLLNQVYF